MAPKIYHLHPLVAGRLLDWGQHFERCRTMGFDTVCIAPPFVPGASGDIFITADYEALHPALGWNGSAEEGITRIAEDAAKHGLKLWLDIALDRVAADAAIRQREEGWFSVGGCGALPNPRRSPHRLDVAYARLDRTEAAESLTDWWLDRLARLVRAGIAGFRCLEPDHIPNAMWRRVISSIREADANIRFLAWTPGVERTALSRLEGLDLDYVCSSLAWWDARASWLIDEHAMLRRIAPVLASPEPSFLERRAAPSDTNGLAPSYRQALQLAAATGAGIVAPMGFEYAVRRAFDAARAEPSDFHRAREESACDLTDDIRQANSLVDHMVSLGVCGEMRALSSPGEPITALLRTDAPDARQATRAAAILINPDLGRAAPIDLPVAPLPPQAGAAFGMPQPLDGADVAVSALAPGEVRVLAYSATRKIKDLAAPAKKIEQQEAAATRIAIEAIAPQVPDGCFAIKRLVGEHVTVSADIFADGHDVLTAAVLWRAVDEAEWRRVPMHLTVNDRWEASFAPDRVGRHQFTVEAWWDSWGTFRHDLSAKYDAGQIVTLEIEEGRRMIQSAAERASLQEQSVLRSVLQRLKDANTADQVAVLLALETLAAMHAVDSRPFCARHEPPLTLDSDRPQAGFASWYELFPRSVTNDPTRHGTFSDVIERLPAIRAMGFDVLYFPPIHPIGTMNRKGRNNALRAEPGDVGSPYAIGGPEGGHDAIHPQLGSLADFRSLVAAAKEYGLEIALDFAIQCSPDHPWLREHPDWFRWRPDGSMRFAENPPKKYEDIVNPDFYAEAAMPSLWIALRDIVQFWVEQGVHTFRVDNPHTKPLPFWQWMIGDIRSRHPDVIFLSEAFTRPKMMYRLAKVGFTQSYTYFTWRNTKQEITAYLTELNSSPIRDFFRPNFFVNTPDINPPFLQTSGRAGFLIRAALACTLSGLWGMYSGFEICESAPLPGREEYLDSEKYQIRVRDFSAPGNIVGEITALNRIRRAHPALQSHLGLTFYNAFNDQVLLYGKMTSRRHDMLLVAVSLDPHAPQTAAIEVPLWEFGLPDHGSVAVTDLMHGHQFVWSGKNQTIYLDPVDIPFSIWQITPR